MDAETLLAGTDLVRAFETHGRSLSAIAAAWVGRFEVPDLLQEAARVAWQRRSRFDGGSDMRAWLAQIIRNIGANWRRRTHAVPLESTELLDGQGHRSAQLDGSFDAEHLGLPDELARGLARLSETERECLLLHVVAGHTFGEIGNILDISHNTAQSHARRAREALKASMASTTTSNLSRSEVP